MSLLSTFVQNQLIQALESEFTAHSADLQAAFISEITAFVEEVMTWIQSKAESKIDTSNQSE